jgi:hypothetical protein
VRDVEVEAGYAAAIAVEGRPDRIPRAAVPIAGSLAALLL